MGKGTLTISSASAGSGKTYKLTGIYLSALFRSRFNYRKILAVTFTHKATAEMKSRILDNLSKLATGEYSDYLPSLKETTLKNEEWIRNEAKEILNSILHDFSRFSVSTIDSFFQKILRAFAREAGLHSGFNIELDHSAILSSAVDEMISSAAGDVQLRKWLIDYAMVNIDDEKSWNLKDGILKLAGELFREKFKILSADERSKLENKELLSKYIIRLREIKSSFNKKYVEFGKRADEIYSEFLLSEDMFYMKGRGVPGFIRSMVSGTVKDPNKAVREIAGDPPRWSTGKTTPELEAAIAAGIDRILVEAINFYDNNILDYRSTDAILSNIYALGILSDVLNNVHLITSSENSFLLSDAGEFLNLIISNDQSPFIYEKVGNRYENFMIDEFQDTSIIQWNNFRPLIENSMAGGFDNLVVGDVKQSIYRWRNSDWQILGSELDALVDNDRYISDPLMTNWRSRSNIISFNNTLFSVIPGQIDEVLNMDSPFVPFKKLYCEAIQTDPGKKSGGYVRVEFLENEGEKKWQESVLEKLPSVIESFLERGYRASDIGIIVRDGKEGASVLRTLINYNNTYPAEKNNNCKFNVVSNDSLLLSNSPVINFLIAVLSVLNDPGDMISRAGMLRFFLLAKGDENADKALLISNKLIEGSGNYFPEGYEDFLDSARNMPLFEATENIVRFFHLGDYSWNVVYLNTFQDYILSFSGNKNSDIQSFLDWWESTGIMKSVVLPGNQEAMRILTIHKSKGLEFKVVILPFLSWNLDHLPSKQPIIWAKPTVYPFNELGIVPVRYSRELSETIFADDYKKEKYSIYLDNINLLYVAFTRAIDALYAFSDDSPRSENTIAGVLKNAITTNSAVIDDQGLSLNGFYNNEKRVFEFGEIPINKREVTDNPGLISSNYAVSHEMGSLKLKLHGESYFSSDSIEIRKKINYGKLMHEVFEGIKSAADISYAVRKLVLEGNLPEEDSAGLEARINTLISSPEVIGWFMAGNDVVNEADILLPSGNTRRPDRVIFKDGKTIIIDFKFGEENPHYIEQVDKYRNLLTNMGYLNIEAYIWYVDKAKVISA